ncbi:MAG: arsenate reductase ArsC [Desulfobulbus sp.]
MSASDFTTEPRKMTILFLCTGNSCRSQMAEGWARHLKGEKIEPYSAGIEKHGLNPLAVRVMAETGVDISPQQSKLIDELPSTPFDFVVTLCDHAHESCPYFPGRIIHRGFPDPPHLAKDASSEEAILQAYRSVRDLIRDFVETLPDSLTN